MGQDFLPEHVLAWDNPYCNVLNNDSHEVTACINSTHTIFGGLSVTIWRLGFAFAGWHLLIWRWAR